MKITPKEYSKKMDELMDSKDFKKLDIDEQLMSMLELSAKYKLRDKKI